MGWLEPVSLTGPAAELQPLLPGHFADLLEAARDGELWNLWYTSVPRPEALQAQGAMLPFAVIDPTSRKAVGMTTYMNVDAINRRVEIGSTWYRQAVQRTALNTQCKLLLLRHAFEALDCIAVEFRTHVLNQRSRRAIERLGAKLDGILRQHQRTADGSLRDTCVYSIIASEWPAVRANLNWQLARPRD
jgi:RimJ/RimL family protein N-acetyltransferase